MTPYNICLGAYQLIAENFIDDATNTEYTALNNGVYSFNITKNGTTNLTVFYKGETIQPEKIVFNISGLPQNATPDILLLNENGNHQVSINGNGTYELELRTLSLEK